MFCPGCPYSHRNSQISRVFQHLLKFEYNSNTADERISNSVQLVFVFIFYFIYLFIFVIVVVVVIFLFKYFAHIQHSRYAYSSNLFFNTL